jgi:hypothetical protein
MISTNKKFDLNEFPVAYFCDNKKSNELRKDLIKNQVRVSEYDISPLEDAFFSDENIDLINKQLILGVYKKTNKQVKIPNQSKEKLIIIMRYIYLEYAKHLPYNITDQIRDLNCQVVGQILPDIITNVNQYINYLEEIKYPRQLIPLPNNVNRYNKQLPPLTSIYDNPYNKYLE